jgi:asparagine synthase (glutamine-hydrolysing)
MCGITGWVDWKRDLTAEVSTIDRMIGTMACRGPDASGRWVSPHAVLGHRRLAVIDLPGGVQPMVAGDTERPVAVLTYSGELYNFRELRTELTARGHQFRTVSDTEVVLRAYQEWGVASLSRMNGMYAFAVWDDQERQLVLARDRFGIKPLYYVDYGGGVLFGSEPKAILANPEVAAEVDVHGLADVFTLGMKMPGDAVYRGMREVAPGCVVTATPTSVRTTRYWALEAREHEDTLDNTVTTVRTLLEDIVARQLVSDVPICTLLSGGLDSSAVTALAARHLERHGRGKVNTFSVDFTGPDGAPRDSLRTSQDSPFARQAAAHIGTQHTEIVLDGTDLLDHFGTTLRARDLPGVGDLDASLYLLFRELRNHSTVALTGEAADEVFGGYPWYAAEAANPSGGFPWAAGITNRGALLSGDLRARLDLDAYAADRYAEAVAETPVLPGESEPQRRMRSVFYLNLTRFLPFLLDRKDRMSMAVGLEVRVPFCDHRLVQYAWNIPWGFHTADGGLKDVLRRASADLLPEPVLRREKSAFPSGQTPGYVTAVRDRVREIMADPSSPVRPLLDDRAVAGLLGASGGTGTFSPPPWLPRIVQLDDWLRTYRVRVVG